jgi:tetratricopeptide (TPR) repeat protein
MVALKLVPRENDAAKELFRRFRLTGYPTLLFLTANGEELDRFGDFMPPDDFLAAIDRIRQGDTFAARLARLDETPGDFEILELVYEGLMIREDFPEIFSRISEYQSANPDLDPDPSMPLLQKTFMRQHSWLYRGAGSFYRNDWEGEIPEIREPLSAPSLMALLEENLPEMPRADQADRLRQARTDDAAKILDMMADGDLSPDVLFSNAGFAFDNGFYDRAADLYQKWFDTDEDPHPGDLNQAAWNFFLSRRDLERAIVIARAAYALDSGPSVADTLGQLLYVTGAVDEAVEIEQKAAAEADGEEAKGYAEVVKRMEAGEDMVDRPRFDTYPE